MLSLLSVLACKHDPEPSTGDDDDTSATTGETGETGGLDCNDGLWLPGGYWDIQSSVDVPPEEKLVGRDIAIDPAGKPVVLAQHHSETGTPQSISLHTREGDEGPLSPSASYSGATLSGRTLAPVGRSMAFDSAGVLWIGGALADDEGTIPFVLSFSGGLFGAPIPLDDLTPSGEVSAGPVLTEQGAYWLGTKIDPASLLSELVLWRVDGSGEVEEVFHTTDLAEGDTAGRMFAGALSLTPSGQILFGSGVLPGSGSGGRAALYLYDPAGGSPNEIISLPAETSGAPGLVTDAIVAADDTLTWLWGALTPTRDAPSWLLSEGPLSGPQSSLPIDTVSGPEMAKPHDLVVHPSGVSLVGGSLSRDDEEPLSPIVRMEQDAGFVMHFFAPGPDAGYINALELAPDGQVWALCQYDNDGIGALEITILRLTCYL